MNPSAGGVTFVLESKETWRGCSEEDPRDEGKYLCSQVGLGSPLLSAPQQRAASGGGQAAVHSCHEPEVL